MAVVVAKVIVVAVIVVEIGAVVAEQAAGQTD